MAILCGWASIDEHGRARGGASGDQTGREVKTGPWYYFGQNYVIRPKDRATGQKMASIMKAICNNSHVGYDQGQRTTLFAQMQKNGWNPAKITTNCECDCSSLIAVVVNAVGIKVSKDIWTGNMVAALSQTGRFEVISKGAYLSRDEYLRAGDIIVNTARHVIMALQDGAKGAPSSGSKTTAQVAQEVLDGKWGNGEDRKNRLQAAGYNYATVQKAVNELVKKPAPKKSTATIAKEVIDGKWGNGAARTSALKKAGYDPATIQQEVNRMLSSKKSINAVAKEVVNGKWGNGEQRRKRLKNAGYDPTAVQKEVNRILGI